VLKKPEKARETYAAAVDIVPESFSVWRAYINFECSQLGDESHTNTQALFVKALSDESRLSEDDKEQMWVHYSEYAEDFFPTIAAVRDVEHKYALWKQQSSGSRKRPLDGGDAANTQVRAIRVTLFLRLA
jgi:hypothetical protein